MNLDYATIADIYENGEKSEWFELKPFIMQIGHPASAFNIRCNGKWKYYVCDIAGIHATRLIPAVEKELGKLEKIYKALDKKVSNKKFIENVNEKTLEKTKGDLEKAKALYETKKASLAALEGLNPDDSDYDLVDDAYDTLSNLCETIYRLDEFNQLMKDADSVFAEYE